MAEELGDIIKRKNNDPEQNIRFDGDDILTRKGYTLTPNMVLDQHNLTAIAKLTYIFLLKYAWNKDSCFPGQERLAKDMKVSERHVAEAIKELKKRKLISVKRRGQGNTNIYTLHVRVQSNKEKE